jgi:hypothetical protein
MASINPLPTSFTMYPSRVARFTVFSAICFLLVPTSFLRGAEPFRYPEGTHGQAELKYRNGLPVLTVAGTPEEMGEQIAVLTAQPLQRLVKYPQEMLRKSGLGFLMPQLVKMGNSLLPQFPPDYRKELDAMVKQTGVERDLAVLGNTLPDIVKLAGCSTLIVESDRCTVGGPLFGRNFDFPTLGFLHEYTLVMVYRPKGKHAFVSIGFPGMLGCISGMNDAGLAVATLEVYATSDGSPRLDAKGIPYTMCFRRLLEECTTVAEAEKLLRSMPRTTMNNLAVCDKRGGAVFEITPRNVVVRRGDAGLCACTNHFRSKDLCVPKEMICERYPKLVDTPAEIVANRVPTNGDAPRTPRLSLADVARKLNAANQGDLTLHTMVFEPASLRLHLAFGKTPSSAMPLKQLELAPLFKGG